MSGTSIATSALLAANNGEFKKAAVLSTFAMTSPLLGAMPQTNITGNSYAWNRESALGTTSSRAVGGTWTPNSGQVEERHVALKILGGELDVDAAQIKMHGPQVRSRLEEMKAKYLAQSIGYQLIKGSATAAGGATADMNGINGLQARYGAGFGSNAVVDGGENAGQIIANTGGSDALSIRDLDIAIQACENPTHLLMAKKMRVNIQAYLRSSAAIQMVKDEFGRLVTTYNGLPILDADVLGTVSGLEQLGFNENNDTTTSIYVLSLGDNGLHMVTNGGIDVRDLGEISSAPVYRTRVEYLANLVDEHPRCVVRLYNIADLTAVA